MTVDRNSDKTCINLLFVLLQSKDRVTWVTHPNLEKSQPLKFSRRGATGAYIFTGTMDSNFYHQILVLRDRLLPILTAHIRRDIGFYKTMVHNTYKHGHSFGPQHI